MGAPHAVRWLVMLGYGGGHANLVFAAALAVDVGSVYFAAFCLLLIARRCRKHRLQRCLHHRQARV